PQEPRPRGDRRATAAPVEECGACRARRARHRGEVAAPTKTEHSLARRSPDPGAIGLRQQPGLFRCADNQRRKLNRLSPLTLTKLCCAACNTMLCMLSRLSASA